MSKYRSQIWQRLKWYVNRRATPPPAWFYPTDGWISDADEIVRLTRNGL